MSLAVAPLFLFSVLGPWAVSDTANVAPLSQALAARWLSPSAAWDTPSRPHSSADCREKNVDLSLNSGSASMDSGNSLPGISVRRYRTLHFSGRGSVRPPRSSVGRDASQVFLQPDPTYPATTSNQVSPNGFWIDLDIEHGERSDPDSGMKCRTHIDEKSKVWTAEVAIPLRSLALHFGPSSVWRAIFFRVEGAAEPRFYSSWRRQTLRNQICHVRPPSEN